MEQLSGTSFNSCLLNMYRDGKDSLSWHSDNEKPYGPQPTIGACFVLPAFKWYSRLVSDHHTILNG